jgi:hypothetical protein
VQLVIAIVAIGFPIALVIAWAFEPTPEGLKRTEEIIRNPYRASALLAGATDAVALQSTSPEGAVWQKIAG